MFVRAHISIDNLSMKRSFRVEILTVLAPKIPIGEAEHPVC